LTAQESESIVKIEVIGAQKQTAETVIFKSGVKVGDDLRELDFSAVLEKLWANGSFDDIKLELEDAPGGKKLIIRIKERPLIKEVDFRGGTEVGLTNIKDKVKEKKLTINPDTVYDPDSARKIKDLIVEQAGEKGFRNPVVDISLEPLPGGVARLVFDIKEGGQGPHLQGGLPGEQGILLLETAECDGKDQAALDVQLGHHPRPAGGQEPGRGPREPEEGLLEAGLQGRLHREAHHRGGRPHHREAEEKERAAGEGGQDPQVRSPGHPHHPHSGRRPVLRGHLQD
jgi:hypothetical protein